MNIVIPMAGLGSRFLKAGFTNPKPLIDVNGKPMIVRVLENLAYPNARYILIARNEYLTQTKQAIKNFLPNIQVDFLGIDKLTEGSVCTILHARKYINNETSLLIANTDQIIEHNVANFIQDCKLRNLDGSILTFEDDELNSKWSFARVENNLVVEVREKEAISKYATVGIYLFMRGHMFVDGAIDMIAANERVNNEFYTCPVYNYAIKNGAKIGIYNIESSAMHGIGTPEDLAIYKAHVKITQNNL